MRIYDIIYNWMLYGGIFGCFPTTMFQEVR
jgi:hypothetical protein